MPSAVKDDSATRISTLTTVAASDSEDGAQEASISRARELWAQMLKEKRQDLVKAGATKALKVQDFKTMEASVKDIQSSTRQSRITSGLLKLSPIVERLQGFIKIVSVFVQSDPTIAALVWGSILVCLECFSQSTKALNNVADFFDKMTRAMPRFEKYIELYPKSEGLALTLLDIYRNYIDATLIAIRYFRQKPWWRPVSAILTDVIVNFEKTCGSLNEMTQEFDKEVNLARDIEEFKHRGKAEQHFQRIEEALPHVAVRSNVPNSLFSVPFPQNVHFLGQEEELKQLEEVAAGADQSQRSCVVHGIGGVGKTNLALEFCHRYRTRFRYVLWLAAQNEVTLSESYTKIATMLGLYDGDQTQTSLITDVVRRWFCENTGWLIVFDNVDHDGSILNQYWPPCQHGSIVLTSQRTDLGFRTTNSLHLKPLQGDRGSDLLMDFLAEGGYEANRELAEEVSREVDGLPLLLVGLGGFLSQSHMSLEDVLQVLRESREGSKYLFSDMAVFQYERPIRLVFRLSLERLPTAARELINTMSMLAPNNIPESILLSLAVPPEGLMRKPSGKALKAMWFAKEVRQSLGSRHLIDVSDPSGKIERMYSIHRSVQRSILEILSEDAEKQQAAFDQAVGAVHDALPKPSPIMVPSRSGFDLFQTFVPHVLSLHETYIKSSPQLEPTFSFAEMICSASAYLYEMGLVNLCLQIATTGEEVCKQLETKARNSSTDLDLSLASPGSGNSLGANLGVDTPTAGTVRTLGANISAYVAGVIWMTGGIRNRHQGHHMGLKVLKAREQRVNNPLYGPASNEDETLLSNAYNDWSLQLMNEGKYQDAKPYIEKSLEIKGRLHDSDKDQFQFFVSKTSLALVYMSEGDSKKALDMAEEGIRHIEKEKGAEDPYTLCFSFDLANLLVATGDYQKAIVLHKKIVKAKVDLFGEANHDTLNSYFAVALCHYRLGNQAEASVHLKHCFDNSQAAHWGEEHILRARWLEALILQRSNVVEDQEKGLALEIKAISQRNDLLSAHGEHDWTEPVAGVDDIVYFDFLVNLMAGRTTMVEL